MSMLVVGSVAFDTLHNALGTHPKVLGGSATYASIAASVFCPVQLVGVVGRDFPDQAVQLLRRRGVDVEGLEVQDGLTFHWEGRYANDLTSRTTLATDLNVFANFRPKIPASFRTTPFVMLGNIDPELQLEVLDQVERPQLVVADTMNFWIDGKPNELAKMMKRVDVFVINDEEARQLGGAHNLVTVAKNLRGMGPRVVIIKRGEHGALLFEGDEIFSAPAFPLGEVLDPTGAGDTFAGALLGFIASTKDASHGNLRRAVVYGSAVASFCVEGIGTRRLEALTRDEVGVRYRAFRGLVHFAHEDELR